METRISYIPRGVARGILQRAQGLLAFAAAFLACRSAGAGPNISESEVKAAFIYHFTQFVQWPETAFASDTSPFFIGVLRPSPFGGVLSELVRGESVGRHPILVRDLSDPAAARDCEILYIPSGAETTLDLAGVRGLPVLTIGETQHFFDDGGVIEFMTDRRRLRVRINLGAARAHMLSISAKLLRVSDVVDASPLTLDGGPADQIASGRPEGDETGIGDPAPAVAIRWPGRGRLALPGGFGQ
ncbi:MAG TPA: YfiR family protein [Opitutaceae bacterium]|jgi:hypothetical protein